MTIAPAAPGKALPPELQRALSKVTDIGSLPEITTRVMELVEDPDATVRDMHALIQRDPALAAKILRVVNSAFYGLPAQVGSLERAVTMLGLTAVKNLALSASLGHMFKAEQLSTQFTVRDLWLHSVAVAVCARALAGLGRAAPPDEAFLAGLMHDIGLLVEQQLFSEKLRNIIDLCTSESTEFCELERRELGADHQAFGGAIALKWKFPPLLHRAIAYHHEPTLLQPEFQRIAVVVHVADNLCCARRYGFWLPPPAAGSAEALLSLIHVAPEQMAALGEELDERVAEAERVFAS